MNNWINFFLLSEDKSVYNKLDWQYKKNHKNSLTNKKLILTLILPIWLRMKVEEFKKCLEDIIDPPYFLDTDGYKKIADVLILVNEKALLVSLEDDRIWGAIKFIKEQIFVEMKNTEDDCVCSLYLHQLLQSILYLYALNKSKQLLDKIILTERIAELLIWILYMK